MLRWMLVGMMLLAALLLVPSTTLPCTLCGAGNPQDSQTLRQSAASAKLIIYGTLANPRLAKDDDGLAGKGTTDLKIERVLKSDPWLGDKKVVEINRYIPVDPKAPPKFLVFCDILNNQLDPYRGVPVKAAVLVDYLKGAIAVDPKNSTKSLLYFFDYLDSTDQTVATDAYLEFAKANDQEIGQVAKKLSPDKLRRIMQDAQTPALRLGLFAFLLGACGGDRDAALLRSMIEKPNERTKEALSGIFAGYIALKPRDGWDLALSILRDGQRPFLERNAVLGTLRFYHGSKPDESRRDVLRGLAAVLDQGDIADIAVEDLRRWQIWDLTSDVLAQYGKKSHDAPLVRRTIIRYAISCPKPEAARFVAERRKEDAELVKEIEESLEFEKTK